MGAEPAPGTGAFDTAPNVEPDVGPGMGPDVAGGGGILADCEEAGGGTETRTGTGTGEYHQGLWHSAHMDVLLRAAEARADIPPAAVLFFGLLMSPTATTF